MNDLTLICTAMGMEAAACRKAVASADSRFEVLQSGMGMKNARRALEARLGDSTRPRPTRIVSTGFAGSATRSLEVGTWLLGTQVTARGKPPLTTSREMEKILTQTRTPFKSAEYLCIDTIEHFSDGADKTMGIDMESYAWAEVAKAAAVPFDILRIVSDNPSQPIPQCIGSFALISIAESHSAKLKLALQGAKQAIGEIRSIPRFLKKAAKMPDTLERGWKKIASP